MGDGYWSPSHACLTVCTECFTFEEVQRLQVLLFEKLKLNTILKKRYIRAGIWKNYRRAFNKQKNIENLVKLVTPYIYSSMFYKLNKQNF
jgi:hypothetical protein